MAEQVRIEIRSRDSFWARAFHVEWEHQFPDRKLLAEGEGRYIVEAEWLEGLHRVAEQTFSRVVRAPDNPQRRRWMNLLARLRDED